MVPYAVSHGLNQNGSHFAERHLTSFKCGVVNGEDVVAIDTHRQHAVGWSATGDSVASVLFLGRCRNGVTVVAAAGKQTIMNMQSSRKTVNHLPEKDNGAV